MKAGGKKRNYSFLGELLILDKIFQRSWSWENLKIRFILRLKHLNFWLLYKGIYKLGIYKLIYLSSLSSQWRGSPHSQWNLDIYKVNLLISCSDLLFRPGICFGVTYHSFSFLNFSSTILQYAYRITKVGKCLWYHQVQTLIKHPNANKIISHGHVPYPVTSWPLPGMMTLLPPWASHS